MRGAVARAAAVEYGVEEFWQVVGAEERDGGLYVRYEDGALAFYPAHVNDRPEASS
jgi:hypothetical protein